MAGEEVEEEPPPVAGDLFEWDVIHCPPPVSAVLPPPKTPWIVAIRNHEKHGSNDPPMVFPPIDNENLHISPSPPATLERITYIGDVNQRMFSDYDSNADSNSSSTFSPSDSSPAPLSPLFPAARWLSSWLEILNSKVNDLMQFFCSTSSRRVSFTFRFATFTAIQIASLYFGRGMRLRDEERSTDRLIGIIKERDEKIKSTAGSNIADESGVGFTP